MSVRLFSGLHLELNSIDFIHDSGKLVVSQRVAGTAAVL
jgi:hypothetical protein